MGVMDRWRLTTEAAVNMDRPPRSVLAAAMPLQGPGVQRVRTARGRAQGAEEWQNQAWYFYDVVGELRAPVNWIANAVSRADIHAAEVDTDTGTVAGPTEDERVQRAASLVLGGMAQRAQLQWLLAVMWQVPGEAYIVIRPSAVQGAPDEWLVLSRSQMEIKGDRWKYTDPKTLAGVTLGGRDRLIRVWCPHPNDQAKADSAVRPALVPLREVEKASQNISARLDSRLAGNGLLFIPEEIDYPQGDFESKAEAFSDLLLTAMEASLQNPGSATGQVPIVATVPGEMIGQMQHLDLSTQFDASIVDLRSDALHRLASTLDMPKPVAEGTQGEMNHWSAWLINEDTYKIFVEPLLDRLGDALTEHWFHPVLEAMGVQDPGRYVLAWDTTEIVSRPDRSTELDTLYDRGLISDDFRRAEAGIPDDAVPSDDEIRLRFLRTAARDNPSILATPWIAEALGYDAPEPEPVEVTGGNPEPAQLPARGEETRSTPGTRDDVPDGLVAAAELLVFDALSRAGGRLLTREYRGQFGHVAKHELHTVIAAKEVGPLLEGSFQFAGIVAEQFGADPRKFTDALRSYVKFRIVDRSPHDRDELRRTLR